MSIIFDFFKRLWRFICRKRHSNSAYRDVPDGTHIRTISATTLADNLDQNEFEHHYTIIRNRIESSINELHNHNYGSEYFLIEVNYDIPSSVRDQLKEDGFILTEHQPDGFSNMYRTWRITLPKSKNPRIHASALAKDFTDYSDDDDDDDNSDIDSIGVFNAPTEETK